MRLDLTLMQVKAVSDMLADAYGDDEQLLHDTLEGETDLYELTAKLLNGIERDEGDMKVLAEQISDRTMRSNRAKARVKARREAIAALMEAARVDTLKLPEATVSWRLTAPKLAINDPQAVPDEFTAIKRVPDKALIDAAFTTDGDLPNWLTVDPAKPTITVRRK